MKESTKRGIDNYVEKHVPVGSFLQAVLENNLKEAMFGADDDNILDIVDIVRYCHWEIPSICWGSPEKVEKWLDRSQNNGVCNER